PYHLDQAAHIDLRRKPSREYAETRILGERVKGADGLSDRRPYTAKTKPSRIHQIWTEDVRFFQAVHLSEGEILGEHVHERIGRSKRRPVVEPAPSKTVLV